MNNLDKKSETKREIFTIVVLTVIFFLLLINNVYGADYIVEQWGYQHGYTNRTITGGESLGVIAFDSDSYVDEFEFEITYEGIVANGLIGYRVDQLTGATGTVVYSQSVLYAPTACDDTSNPCLSNVFFDSVTAYEFQEGETYEVIITTSTGDGPWKITSSTPTVNPLLVARVQDSSLQSLGAEYIEWLTPTSSGSYSDFSQFQFKHYNFTTHENYYIKVYYSTPNLDILFDYQDRNTVCDIDLYYVNNGTCYVEKTHDLYYPDWQDPTPWSAYAELYEISTGDLLYVTDTITFDIATSTSNFTAQAIPPSYDPYQNDPSASSSIFFHDCTMYDGISFFSSGTIASWGCETIKAGKGIIGWTLVPPDWALENLKESADFSTVFPFNIWYGISDQIEYIGQQIIVDNTSTSVSITSVGPLELGETELLGPTTLRDLLTTDECNVSCAQDIVDDLFLFIAFFIWVAFLIRVAFLIF